MDEPVARELIKAHFAASAVGAPGGGPDDDIAAASEIYAEDAVLEWPQDRERVRGKADIIAFRSTYPTWMEFELMGISVSSAMTAFHPREGVDRIWPGDGVIYSRRLGAQRTKSRLSSVMSSPLYKSMTIRSWRTTVRLDDRLRAMGSRSSIAPAE